MELSSSRPQSKRRRKRTVDELIDVVAVAREIRRLRDAFVVWYGLGFVTSYDEGCDDVQWTEALASFAEVLETAPQSYEAFEQMHKSRRALLARCAALHGCHTDEGRLRNLMYAAQFQIDESARRQVALIFPQHLDSPKYAAFDKDRLYKRLSVRTFIDVVQPQSDVPTCAPWPGAGAALTRRCAPAQSILSDLPSSMVLAGEGPFRTFLGCVVEKFIGPWIVDNYRLFLTLGQRYTFTAEQLKVIDDVFHNGSQRFTAPRAVHWEVCSGQARLTSFADNTNAGWLSFEFDNVCERCRTPSVISFVLAEWNDTKRTE